MSQDTPSELCRAVGRTLGLLPDTSAKLVDVALQVGYENEAAFSRAFKRVVGAAAGAWRHGERSGPRPAARAGTGAPPRVGDASRGNVSPTPGDLF